MNELAESEIANFIDRCDEVVLTLTKKSSLKSKYMEKDLLLLREELLQKIYNLRSNGTKSMMKHELYEIMPETDMQLICMPKLLFKFRKGLVFNLTM